jgi:hypothetical protein
MRTPESFCGKTPDVDPDLLRKDELERQRGQEKDDADSWKRAQRIPVPPPPSSTPPPADDGYGVEIGFQL